jgi:hypothetical protein
MKIEIFILIKTNPAKINYIFRKLYNILSKDEKRARVGETEIVERQGRAGLGKLSKRVRTCDRKPLENFL